MKNRIIGILLITFLLSALCVMLVVMSVLCRFGGELQKQKQEKTFQNK